jgi:hypothetical protein
VCNEVKFCTELEWSNRAESLKAAVAENPSNVLPHYSHPGIKLALASRNHWQSCMDYAGSLKDSPCCNIAQHMRTFLAAMATTVVLLALSGCASLGEQPKGCIPLSEAKAIAISAPRASGAVPQPYQSTLMRLENGRFTYPIASVETIDRFRTNLFIAAGRHKNLRMVSARELIQFTEFDSTSPEKAQYATIVSEAAQATSLSGIAVTTTLISIEQILDDLLNRANSMVSSQLFAMRSHVAATVSDINVVLKDRMQDGYDKLNEQQRQVLDRAMLLANEAQASLDKLVKDGAFAASDLLCQTTVNFANYPNTIVGLGLPFERCFSPDILCLSSLEVRDVGTPQAEQMLQFRGVNLLPNNEYADATLLLSGKETNLPTAGGKSVLQLPLPGGLNGKSGDTSLRGPLMEPTRRMSNE